MRQRNITLLQANKFFLVPTCEDTYQKHVQSRGWYSFKGKPLIWRQHCIKLTLIIILWRSEVLEKEWDPCLLSLLTNYNMIAKGQSQLSASCRKITKIKKLPLGATQLFKGIHFSFWHFTVNRGKENLFYFRWNVGGEQISFKVAYK